MTNEPSVCLFGPNRGWRPSMDRFTEALAQDSSGRVRRAGTADGRPQHPASTRGGAEWTSRWLAYPMIARRERADVYHITDHSYGHLAAVLPGPRTVITCHDLIPLRGDEMDLGFRLPRRAVAQFRLSVGFLRRVACVVADSEATRSDIVHYLRVPPERVDVVPLAVDAAFRPLPDADRNVVRRRLGVAPRFAVAHIGVAPYKDLQTVVRTLARVRERGIDAVLVHVGEPWPHDAARLVDELGLSEHVVRLGGVDEQQLVEVLGAADCLLFPSLWEGFGLPPAEAMACGLPVVHSDTPALVELMRGAGLAARPRDVRGLAEHVFTLATDPGVRQRLARDGLARAEALTWDATRAGYRRVYERIHAQVGAGR